MSDFLTGGQVTAHRFRMFGQVVRIIFRATLIAIVFNFIFTFKANISLQEWRLLPAMIKMYVFQDFNPNQTVEYRNRWNRPVIEKVNYFKNNRLVKLTEKNFESVFFLSVQRSLYVVAGAVFIPFIFFCFKGRNLKKKKKMRGSFLLSEKELKKQAKKHNKKFKGIKPYTLSGVQYVATGRGRAYTPGEQAHTLVLGATGSGKTKIIQDLVKQIHSRGGKAIIVDIKGDYISHFYDKSKGDIILNPLDKRGSNWSFFKETDVLAGFDTIAKTLMPDAGKDPFWVNAARRIFSELAKLYWDEDLSLSEFADKILYSDISFLEKVLADTPAKHLVDQKADKTVACVMMMLTTYLAPLKLYTKKNKVFSINEWINDDSKNNFLFISTSSEAKESLNPLVQMQVDLAINALCSSRKKSKKPVWFILDELPYFDKSLPNLKDGLTTARSFGGAFVLGTQDMSSLSKIYGQDLSRVIANNCRNKLIMNVDDNYTARWCSELIGEGELEEWHEGISYGAHQMRDGVSANKTKVMKRAVLPAEFSQLMTGQGYLRLPGFNTAMISFDDYYLQSKNAPYIEDGALKDHLMKVIKDTQKRKRELETVITKPASKIKTDKDLSDEFFENTQDLLQPEGKSF
ncbi:MAG: DUF853 family protein [Rickettsiales bacterium]